MHHHCSGCLFCESLSQRCYLVTALSIRRSFYLQSNYQTPQQYFNYYSKISNIKPGSLTYNAFQIEEKQYVYKRPLMVFKYFILNRNNRFIRDFSKLKQRMSTLIKYYRVYLSENLLSGLLYCRLNLANVKLFLP